MLLPVSQCLAHMIAALAPVVTGEAGHDKSVRRGRRQHDAHAAVPAAVTGTGRKDLRARNISAKKFRKFPEAEHRRRAWL